MTKDEAQKKIQELTRKADEVIVEAMKLADEHGLTFAFEPEHIGEYFGKGAPAPYGYGDEDEKSEGEWSPSSWSSSSIYC